MKDRTSIYIRDFVKYPFADDTFDSRVSPKYDDLDNLVWVALTRDIADEIESQTEGWLIFKEI